MVFNIQITICNIYTINVITNQIKKTTFSKTVKFETLSSLQPSTFVILFHRLFESKIKLMLAKFACALYFLIFSIVSGYVKIGSVFTRPYEERNILILNDADSKRINNLVDLSSPKVKVMICLNYPEFRFWV